MTLDSQALKLIDVHSHLHFPPFDSDRAEVFARMAERNIGTILVGTSMETSRSAVEIAAQYDNVWAAVGMHPSHFHSEHHDADELSDDEHYAKSPFNAAVMRELAQSPKVVAIGECGLDYSRDGNTEDAKRAQREGFLAQIAIARELKKPLVIHCRDAYEDAYEILHKECVQDIGGHMHFFAGDWEIAKKFLHLNLLLSFTGVITFTRQYDSVIENTPLSEILIETDAPYVAPVPYRGKRNESLYVEEVAKRIAEIKGVSYDEVARVTTENAIKLFRLH